MRDEFASETEESNNSDSDIVTLDVPPPSNRAAAGSDGDGEGINLGVFRSREIKIAQPVRVEICRVWCFAVGIMIVLLQSVCLGNILLVL